MSSFVVPMAILNFDIAFEAASDAAFGPGAQPAVRALGPFYPTKFDGWLPLGSPAKRP